jgi:hypothetical protein
VVDVQLGGEAGGAGRLERLACAASVPSLPRPAGQREAMHVSTLVPYIRAAIGLRSTFWRTP